MSMPCPIQPLAQGRLIERAIDQRMDDCPNTVALEPRKFRANRRPRVTSVVRISRRFVPGGFTSGIASSSIGVPSAINFE